jgi:hypothetical protein
LCETLTTDSQRTVLSAQFIYEIGALDQVT